MKRSRRPVLQVGVARWSSGMSDRADSSVGVAWSMRGKVVVRRLVVGQWWRVIIDIAVVRTFL